MQFQSPICSKAIKHLNVNIIPLLFSCIEYPSSWPDRLNVEGSSSSSALTGDGLGEWSGPAIEKGMRARTLHRLLVLYSCSECS